MSKTDLVFENHFSLFLIRPVSSIGENWLDSHIADDAQTWGNAVVVEPRYVADIFKGAVQDNLACKIYGPGITVRAS